MTVLVVGVGNVLRGDDGFGVAVVERLSAQPLPPGVRVLDIGIGGIHLVQELLEPVDAVVAVDAVDVGRPPGTVVVLRPHILEPTGPDDLADVHYATPERAFMLAHALGLLPAAVWIVGCQAADAERVGQGLSQTVADSVDTAVAEVRRLVSELGVDWPAHDTLAT